MPIYPIPTHYFFFVSAVRKKRRQVKFHQGFSEVAMAICAAKGIPSSSMRLILSSSFCSLKCVGFKYRPAFLSYSVKAQHYLSKNRSILTLARTTFSPTQRLPVRAFMSTAISAESSHAPTASKSYDATQIQVLEGLDPVRKRPGMYIGSTGPRGLHHLVFEVLDNAVDEAQAGFATDINIVLHSDGSVSITDNGRGIPTDMHPATKKSSLETVLTVLHAGGKFGGEQSGYSISGGLHGVGISVVNALSKRLEVTVWRNGKEWKQIFERGVPVTELTSEFIKEDSELNQGTRVKFLPDDEVFITTTTFDYNTIAERAREVAFLNPKVKITLKQEMEEGKVTSNEYYFAGGLSEYVQFLNQNKNQLHQPFSVNKEKDGVAVNVALQWCSDSYAEKLLGYANSIRTIDGGSHMDGLKSAITRAMNNVGRQLNIMKDKDENLSGEHVREGLTGIVSVKISKPEFEGQTKTRLGNPEVRKIVDQAVYDYFMDYLQCNPTICESILSKALNAYKAAMAAKRARELERKKSSLRSSAIPGKLANCSETDASKREIFIVEGESAGGSAKQGRDRRFQAILPLRGKILNVERKDEEAMYKNKEIHDLICALGIGEEGEDFRKNLNYHKIIILTDADVDGAHIRTLLLTFFFRYQKALFEEGVVYVGVPPLYKVERGKKATYCFDDNALKTLLKDYPDNSSYNIQRFKGLGEMMPLQLWETTMNPATRKLKQLTIDDAEEADSVFTLLMGSNVEPRKKLIESSASKYMLENLDI